MRRIVVHTDGGARGNPGPAGYGAVLTDADTGDRLATRSGYLGRTTNNVAEYTAVVEGLRAAARIDADAEVEVRADSKLVVEQMSGRWKIKHEDMRRLALEARDAFPPHRVAYTWIPRAANADADALANRAMDARGDSASDEWLTSLSPTAELGSESDEAWPGVPQAGETADTAGDAEAPTALFDVAEPTPTGAGSVDGSAWGRAPAEHAAADRSDADRTPAEQPAFGSPPLRTGDATRIYLVRHGVTDWTTLGRQSGSDTPGPDLTELGRRQARNAGRLLLALSEDDGSDLATADFRVSPMVRTRQTAEEIAAVTGLGEPLVDERLREVTFGEWDGLTEAQIDGGWPGDLEIWRGDVDRVAPGGESHRQVGARVARVLKEAMGTERKAVVLVAHSVVIRTAVALVARIEPAAWGRVRVRPGSVTMLGVAGVDQHGRFEGQVNYVGAPAESVGH